ncbi:hypothetical protein TNCT_641342 [Trichonephila clavata]|uniref:EGF-like domain-containing protein n=1 Tax=Trichonephila clavata TaxID=2740835 RepID=A0A8X6JAV8_TRICU|nr:hypothetical protein TNCT_641342 [Trichonephila clavata]
MSSYNCHCPRGYVGKTCEIKDPCMKNPCKNGGRCTFDTSSYNCVCSHGYVGKTCEIKDPCTENPCKNGGICEISLHSFKCVCRASYSGPTCEEDSCTDNPCLNGGICELDGDYFKCNCMHPFSGKFCDTEIASKVITTSTGSPTKFSTSPEEDYMSTIKSTHLIFNETTSIHNWTSQEPTKFSFYLNTTYKPLNFTHDMNATTFDPKKITSDFTSSTFKPESVKTVSNDVSETTINLNLTTVDLTKSTNFTEITKSYNWTSQEPSNFTYFLNTTHVPPNTTHVMNITTVKPGICRENSDCLNGGFCRRTKSFEFFCDCPPNFMGERCEVNLCGEMDRLCGTLGAICKIIGQNAICVCPPSKIHNPISGICEDACSLQQCLHGSCEIVGQYYRCNCHEGYTGFHCDEVVRKKEENYSALITSVGSFLLFICLLLTGTFYFIYRIHLTLKIFGIPQNTN